MSKSKGNVVDPDDMIGKYGADALRLYVMFVAPPEKEIEWTDAGLEGSFRFLARVWRLVDHLAPALAAAPAPDGGAAPDETERALRRKTHDTIRRVTQDLDPKAHLNTAISAVMELVNDLYLFCDRPDVGLGGRRGDDEAGAVTRGARDARRPEGGRRGARAHAVALHAAHERGALGGAGARGRRGRRGLAGVRRDGGARRGGSWCPCRSTASCARG